MHSKIPLDDVLLTPNIKVELYSKKWRHERNFWISALVLVLWYVLGGLMRLQEENAALRDKLMALKHESESGEDLAGVSSTEPEMRTKEKPSESEEDLGGESATAPDTPEGPNETQTESKKDK